MKKIVNVLVGCIAVAIVFGVSLFVSKQVSAAVTYTGNVHITEDTVVNERIVVKGNVTISVDKGVTLEAKQGITVEDKNSLTIDGKGKIIATGNCKGGAGTAIVVAAGVKGVDILDLSRQLVKPKQTFTPNQENKEVYEKYYNIFKKLYKSNKSNFHKINS